MSGSRATSGIARHFEGWQLGLLAVGVALCGLWLALPRPVEPELLPLPEVDRDVVLRARNEERGLAREAERSGLPFEVRAVGELLRRHGKNVVARDANEARQARDDARRLVAKIVRESGWEGLRRLRAVQTELFLGSVAELRAGAPSSVELDELAGNFVQKGKSLGWFDAKGRLCLSEDELFVLFRIRWTELIGRLESPELRPRLDEFRLYYRVLLEQPGGGSKREQDERRLAYLPALARIDGDFPRTLAEGALLYRLGRKEQALVAFSAHLAAHQDGPWALRAKNYALAALAQVQPTE
jgi:hypothetical protein